MYIHLVFLPWIESTKEIKTRPAQYSVRDLQGSGVSPDAVMCRCDHAIPQSGIDKIALAANLSSKAVVPLETAATVYNVPLMLENYGFGNLIVERLKLVRAKADLAEWKELIGKVLAGKRKVTIGLIAKYTSMEDTYLSVLEALRSAGWYHDVDVDIKWIDAEGLESDEVRLDEALSGCSGYVVPGGFGIRGIEGKIKAAQYAREHQIPYLGLCLGMQIAAIEFARNVIGWSSAHSTEFNDKTNHPVIHIMEYQKKITQKGGTMRLGAYPCLLQRGSKAYEAYKKLDINERHRHRFEFNNEYRREFEKHGMLLSGVSPDRELVEIVELKDHPWFVASQFHPEFKSRPNRPHPLFRDFIGAAIKNSSLGFSERQAQSTDPVLKRA